MSGIVFGCIVPHPPLLVPEVGGGREREISATTRAMERLSKELAGHQPDTIFVISPHGASLYDAMGVATARASSGNMLMWGAPGLDFDFENDAEAVSAIQEEAKAAGVPLKSIGEKRYELDHGVTVPLYFLRKGLKQVRLVPLTFSWLPLNIHYTFGKALRRAAERSGRRVALVASGDLSHRLLPEAPAGYDPMGQVFDKKLVEAIERYDARAILGLDEDLVSHAGECGLRSIVILLGALEGLSARPQVLSYEGPFGVGYLVASFDIGGAPAANPGPVGQEAAERPKETHPLVRLARETVESYVRSGRLPRPRELTPEMKERAGVFVSIKKHGQLRGCIGTFEPTRPNVAEEVMANAVSSSTRDPRFPAVTPDELGDLVYSVDILTRPEPIDSPAQLDPRCYGCIVECGGRRGLLLPDLEGVNTVEEQINICCLKAGIEPDEPKKLYRFQVRRYT